MYSWLDLVFNPKSPVEQFVGNALRTMHPYIAYFTYRFHVEKCRESGKRFLLRI